MRIGIEAQRIFRPKKHGMDIVILEVLKQLQYIQSKDEFFVYAQPDSDVSTLHNGYNINLQMPGPASYPVWEQKHLPSAAKKDKVHLLHCTSNTAPVSINIPLIVTIHDIIYLEKWMLREGSWYQRFGNLYRRWNVPKIAKQAQTIITVSNYERERIIEGLKIKPECVKTIYNACGNHFTPDRDVEKLKAFKEKMNLPDRFVLFLGNTDPKKNLPNVMKALGIIYKKGKLDFKLVMPDFGRESLLNILKEQGNEKLIEHVMLTGYIPNNELPNLYRLAEIFLYPSIRESFGIPILEAMACGTPVITSNTSAMPEIAGKDAMLVDPFKAEQIAETILLLLNNNTLRNNTIDYGKKRAADFSWNKTAQEVLSVYRSLS